MNFAVAIDGGKCDNCSDSMAFERHRCVKVCSEKLFFLHCGLVKMDKTVNCNGCEECVKACEQNAITVVNLSLI